MAKLCCSECGNEIVSTELPKEFENVQVACSSCTTASKDALSHIANPVAFLSKTTPVVGKQLETLRHQALDPCYLKKVARNALA